MNSETYISLRQQKLRSCKKIGHEFYCEELFIVKHKSSYNCESAIYFNLTTDIIKNNCDFDFYFNKTDVTPTVLDGGDEIVLANWPHDKHIICNINNDIPIRIPSHPYVLVNRSVLCNCGIEADSQHLLESLATYDNKSTKLIMYFTINLVFTNYLDMIPKLTDSAPIIKDRTKYEQPLHLNLSAPHFDNSLRYRLTKVKDHMNSYINDKEIFVLQQRHATESYTFTSNKNFFSNHTVNIFMFTSSTISIMTITLVVYLFCKHKHIRTIVASLILHKIKEVEANSDSNPETNNYECRTLMHVGIILTVLSMIIVMFLHYRRSRLCRGYKFLNAIKIMLFISDVQNYIPIKLCKTSGNIHLFKIKGTLKSKDIKLNKNYLWDLFEINWNKITITVNDNKIDLPEIVAIKMQDKIRVRRLVNREPLNLHVMKRQGITWYNLETDTETV